MTKELKPKRVDVYDWLELTRPNKPGCTLAQKADLRALRDKVFSDSGAHPRSLVVAKSRLRIGEALYTAIYNATQELEPKYRINVPFSEFSW